MKYYFLSLIVLFTFVQCKEKEKNIDDNTKPAFKLESVNFTNGGNIPDSLSCKAGTAIKSPVLNWNNPFSIAPKSWALIMDDTDAVAVVGYIWNHWVVYNIPAVASGLNGQSLSSGAIVGKNSSGTPVYQGPCPPAGQKHHYIFRLFALSDTLSAGSSASAAELRAAMQGKIIDSALLTGLFQQ